MASLRSPGSGHPTGHWLISELLLPCCTLEVFGLALSVLYLETPSSPMHHAILRTACVHTNHSKSFAPSRVVLVDWLYSSVGCEPR
ncbi:hypothetical protein BJ875DRAFT_457580 [Amylocarpus encephaloides]|uniref:Uncharacterized protein n=1 Tax=Amylocarpus encephaloides TaxID=45428 RepID=A0A9P7YLW9_9HELO|nr:hypothetical protein BJ875DRAFT_457580 [Amylocarpus encephaloides]